MSFSQDVKNEILRHRISKPCCSVAAAYAVACFGKYFDDRGIVLQTENEGVAAFAQKLYRRCGIRGDVLRKERPTGPVFEFSACWSFSATPARNRPCASGRRTSSASTACNPSSLQRFFAVVR